MPGLNGVGATAAVPPDNPSRTVFTRDSICYSAYMLSPVRLSVTWVDHTKTVEVRIMQFLPYSSPTPLVFREQVLSRISSGSPERGR